jgi:hypothetical protein
MSARYEIKNSRQCAPAIGSRVTYSAIVKAYKSEHRGNATREMRFFSDQKSLFDAIELAANAKLSDGSKHSHQWRIPSTVLRRFARCLLNIEDQISHVASFLELWKLVRTEGMSVKGIGELAIYDTAHRIGAYLGLEPEHIYLHAGTRAGARALSLNADGAYLDIERIPAAFRALKPYEIEDCLCIYKTDLAAIRSNS